MQRLTLALALLLLAGCAAHQPTWTEHYRKMTAAGCVPAGEPIGWICPEPERLPTAAEMGGRF